MSHTLNRAREGGGWERETERPQRGERHLDALSTSLLPLPSLSAELRRLHKWKYINYDKTSLEELQTLEK